MSEADNSPVETSGSLSVSEGAAKFESLLFPREDKEEQSVEKNTELAEVDGIEPETEVAEDEAQPEVDQEEAPVYRLKDGTEVTLEEIEDWKRGNLRQQDYTRKTMEIAETRKALETRHNEIAQQSEFLTRNLDLAMEVARANLPAQPDVSMLDTDPIGYVRAQAEYEKKVNELKNLFGAREHLTAQTEQRQAQVQHETVMREAQALTAALPELNDPVKLQAFQADLIKGVSAYGITAEEVASAMDHRVFLMAKDALAYRKLMAKRPEVAAKVQNAAPVQKAGVRTNPSQNAAAASKEKFAALQRSGSMKDATSFFMDRL